MTKKRRWRQRLVASLAGVLLALLVAEIVLRLFTYSTPYSLVSDPVLGYRLRADLEGWDVREQPGRFVTNRDGWRDRERQRVKPPGAVRLAALGDSYVAALQVHQDQTFCAVAEQLFAADPKFTGRPVEVLNFGVDGYGLCQELLVYRQFARNYSPDVVVLGFFIGNDVHNNSRALDGTEHRPYFVLRGDQLELDDAFLRSPAYLDRRGLLATLFLSVADHSRIAQVAVRWRLAYRRRIAVGHRLDLHEAGLSGDVFAEPTQAALQDAWRVTEALLETLQREVAADGGRLVIMVIGAPTQVHPDLEHRQQTATKFGVADLSYPNRRIRAFCERVGILCLDLTPAFAAHAEATGVYLHGAGSLVGFGHWNPGGHRLAAESLVKYLAEKGLVR